MEHYKYYLSLTSQLPFCSVPLRLDSYNKCQFACTYCFAKARGGAINTTKTTAKTLDPKRLDKRLERVRVGRGAGATDEFLSKRIPIQFGGMTDPFSPWEKDKRISLEVLRILARHQYPTIISTKSTLISEPEYLNVLASGNFYVRISFTSVSDKLMALVERGVPDTSRKMETVKILAQAGIPVSARLQPIIPGHEEIAKNLVEQSALAGAVHVSAEYLKLPIETSSNEFSYLNTQFPKLIEYYKSVGAKNVGREFVLPTAAKMDALFELRGFAKKLGLVFGFAENEFLLFNPFKSCCNGADLYLNNAKFFDANILGILRDQITSTSARFGIPDDFWVPTESMLSHLNSKSRGSISEDSPREQWIEILRKKWNAEAWRGGPESYFGMEFSGARDTAGNKIYDFSADYLA